MDRLSNEDLENYVASGQWQGKAGGFGYQDRLGWIPPDKLMVVNAGQQATFLLDRLGMPTGNGYLMAKIPIIGTSKYYTVERREFVGFDKAVPGEAIVIHEVVPGRSRPAQVVDPDGNGNPNDAGSYWEPGEKWNAPGGDWNCQRLRCTRGRSGRGTCGPP